MKIASELGWRHNYNLATAFIDFFAWCGLAYDLKVPSLAMVMKRMERLGEQPNSAEWITRRVDASRAVVIRDTLLGLVTLTVPVWSLVLGRALYLLCAIAQ